MNKLMQALAITVAVFLIVFVTAITFMTWPQMLIPFIVFSVLFAIVYVAITWE